MKFKRLATMLMAAAMMVSLVACAGDNGENSETPVSSGNDVVEETEANHITLAESWGFENFYTIMTPDVSASNFGITYYLSNFYDVLVEYQDGEYVGGLAEDWKISEDGTVYTFNLRHDVKFSDGSDLTAEDVAKSLLAVPINLGQYNGTYGRLSTIIEDAVVVDDYTVEMHLTQPYYNALRELCLANPFGIVSSEQLNDDLTKRILLKLQPMAQVPTCMLEIMTGRLGISRAIPTIGVKNLMLRVFLSRAFLTMMLKSSH